MQQPKTYQRAKPGSKSIPKFRDQNYLLYLSQAIKFYQGKISISEKLKRNLPVSI